MNQNIFSQTPKGIVRWLTLILLLLLTWVVRAGELPSISNATTTAKSPWGKVMMIGASASGGFTAAEPFGGPATKKYRLSPYVDAALTTPHEPIRSVATAFFFLQPDTIARKQVNDVLQAQPSAVLGLDFLFWFCYGDIQTNENRVARFERGLKLLDEIQCPLVIGDIPDASAAVNDMLAPSQIPSAEIMSAANRRLKEWAATRKQVVVIKLTDFMQTVMANEAMTLHGKTYPKGSTRAFIQNDKLHPTPLGCSMLALALIDALQTAQPTTFAGPVRWDAAEVLRIASTTSNAPPTKKSAAAKSSAPAKTVQK